MPDAKMNDAFADFHRIYQLIERAAARILCTLDLPSWLEFDDLIQEGFLMACEAVDRWDPQRARFTTYLYPRLDFFLRREIQRQLPARREHPLPEIDLDRLEAEEDPLHALELHHTLHSLLARLSSEAPLAYKVLIQFFGLEGYRAHPLSVIERRLGLRRGEGEQLLREGLIRLRQMWHEELTCPPENR